MKRIQPFLLGLVTVLLILVAGIAMAGDGFALPQLVSGPTTVPPPTAVPTSTAMPTSTATPLPTRTPMPTSTPSAPPLTARFTPKPGDLVRRIEPGVIHIRRETDDPLKINILLFDLTAPEFDIKVGVGDGWLAGRYRTSYIAEQNHALAGVNGDLFSGDGVPQGLTMIDSQVLIAPKHRATFAWGRDRKPFIGYFTQDPTWDATVETPSGDQHPLSLLNTPCDLGQICVFNQFFRSVPALLGDVKVVLDRDHRVTAIVQESRVRVLTDTMVLQGTGVGAEWLLEHMAVGDQLQLRFVTDPPLSDYTQAISGGPIILKDGAFVQDCLCTLGDCSAPEASEEPAGSYCEDFTGEWKMSHYLWVNMPRTGVAYDKEKQTLIVAVVDGYQRGYSRGIRQDELADLLLEFGADTAMELDGGGSATMVLQDQVMNRPPDDTGERYVTNALLFFWNDLPHHPALQGY